MERAGIFELFLLTSGFGNDNAFFQGYTKQDEKVVTQLPDIEDADFKLLRQNDAKIVS